MKRTRRAPESFFSMAAKLIDGHGTIPVSILQSDQPTHQFRIEITDMRDDSRMVIDDPVRLRAIVRALHSDTWTSTYLPLPSQGTLCYTLFHTQTFHADHGNRLVIMHLVANWLLYEDNNVIVFEDETCASAYAVPGAVVDWFAHPAQH